MTYLDGDTSASSHRFCCVFDSGPEDGDLHRWVNHQHYQNITDPAVCLIQILETVTERLVDGFQAIKHLFKENDPDGGYSVTQ